MYNQVVLLGNVGKIRDIQYDAKGMPILTFQLCTKYKYAKADHANTSWHEIVLFGKFAETIISMLQTGQVVFVEGRINYNIFELEGVRRKTTQIRAEIVRIIKIKTSKVKAQEEIAGSENEDKEEPPEQIMQEEETEEIAAPPPIIPYTDKDIPF